MYDILLDYIRLKWPRNSPEILATRIYLQNHL